MDLLKIISTNNFQYNDNKGYRNSLRVLFNMDSNNYMDKVNEIRSTEQLDDETEDEICYDEESSTKMMDLIYEKTKDNVLFHELYVLAAGRFLSEDPLIGEAVLFCYDYLQLFILCLVDYLKSPNDFNKDNINYINLLKKLS